MALFESLSFNKADKDAIQGGYLDIDVQQNDVGMILLGLLVLWDWLQSRIFLYNATVLLYSIFPWQIWLDIKPSLDEYILYYADNVLQIKKSQIKVKLDQKQQFGAEELAIEVSL